MPRAADDDRRLQPPLVLQTDRRASPKPVRITPDWAHPPSGRLPREIHVNSTIAPKWGYRGFPTCLSSKPVGAGRRGGRGEAPVRWVVDQDQPVRPLELVLVSADPRDRRSVVRLGTALDLVEHVGGSVREWEVAPRSCTIRSRRRRRHAIPGEGSASCVLGRALRKAGQEVTVHGTGRIAEAVKPPCRSSGSALTASASDHVRTNERNAPTPSRAR